MTGDPVRLAAGDPELQLLAAGRVTLVIDGDPVEVELEVPAGPVALHDVLPVFQGLSNLFVARGVARAEGEGRAVSCRAGCGACCRQLVPVSDTEARALAALVEAMPEPRRTEIRARFDAAIEALTPSGVLQRVAIEHETRAQVGMDYFRQGVACPFLEAGACSIHPDRPLACREYLVTSPAEHCSAPSAETIEMVTLASQPSAALVKTSGGWLPLIESLRYTASADPAPRDQTGPQHLAAVISQL